MTVTRSRHASDGPERALRVDDGRVSCPRRGSVDIARCWRCPDYRGLSSGHVEGVLCAADSEVTSGPTPGDQVSPVEHVPR